MELHIITYYIAITFEPLRVGLRNFFGPNLGIRRIYLGSFSLRGQGGVPWGQIMEKEFEYLVDRGGHGGHLAEKFLKKYCS